MKKMILASTSTIYGGTYLAYLVPELKNFFKKVDSILFIPFARPSGISYEDYTSLVADTFKKIAISVDGIHEFENPKEAIENASAVFVGGGNTFALVGKLYELELMESLEKKINEGAPYLGTSAGSVICGPSMKTTNDMPIVQPLNYKTLGCIPFNINAHYLDLDPNSTHNGETRETRIKEYHIYNETPVLGLREGSWLEIKDNSMILKGSLQARWFEKYKEPIELNSDTLIST